MLRADWRTTVDEIERGLKACLESLDRYEAQYQPVMTGPAQPSDPARHVPPRHDGAAERLAVAGERAAVVEQLLDEQQKLWLQFHDSIRELRQATHQARQGIA